MRPTAHDSAAPQATAPRRPRLAAVLAWVLFAGAACGFSALGVAHAATGVNLTEEVARQPQDIGLVGVADLVAKVKPAVVNISVKGELPGGSRVQIPKFKFPPGSPFGEMFKHFFEQQRPPPGREYQAVGSGFIVSPKGFVVTNNHVIKNAESITVIMQDGTRYKAKLIGHDPKTDLAVLKIDAGKPLSYVTWGDSNKQRVGDQVVAIGNPFGLGGTVTTGIISARGRNIESGPYDDYLQIDAPINRGNSGGPLFNLRGQVIGINSAIYSPNGGSVGIGFAIPSNMARPIVEQLEAHGSVQRGWLGVEIQAVTRAIAEGLGLPKDSGGALVAQVMKGSPAAHGGLRTGDVIVGFAGKPIKKLRDLTFAVADTKPGSEAQVRVWRDGRFQDLTVKIGLMPSAAQLAKSQAGPPGVQEGGRLGVSVADLDAAMRKQYDIGRHVRGAVITEVNPGSPAARQGLQPGDVIVMVGQQRVTDAHGAIEAVRAALKKNPKAVLLLIERGGSQHFVAVSMKS